MNKIVLAGRIHHRYYRHVTVSDPRGTVFSAVVGPGDRVFCRGRSGGPILGDKLSYDSLMPRPRPRRGKGLERFLGCAESALRHLPCHFGHERAYCGHSGGRSTIQLSPSAVTGRISFAGSSYSYDGYVCVMKSYIMPRSSHASSLNPAIVTYLNPRLLTQHNQEIAQ